MKITSIKEVEVKNASVTITIDPANQDTIILLVYTCPDCAGYGCHSHGGIIVNSDCSGGSIRVKLDPAKLDKQLDPETAMKLKSAIQNIFLAMTK